MAKFGFRVICILLAACLFASGCSWEAVNRKFIRKKKKQQTSSSIYQMQPYVMPPASQIYEHAFLFWKIWEDELLTALSPSGFPRTVNNLKIKECLDEAAVNLSEMKKRLNDNKALELAPYIKELQQMGTILENQQVLSDTLLGRMRHDVEAHKRNVEIRFSSSAVKKDLQE